MPYLPVRWKSAPSRFGGIIVALALLLGLGGCSAIKLGYNSLPELAYWWLDGYVDFTETQAPQVRDELAKLHGWHRKTELPRIAEILVRMEQAAPRDVTPQQACAFIGDIQSRLNAATEYAEPQLAQLAMTLDAKQLRHLERKYRNVNQEWRRDWILQSQPDQREKRFEQFLERAEMIYGTLQEPQRAVLRRAIDESKFDGQRILGDRERRQQDLLQTLKRISSTDATPAAARAQIHAYLDRALTSPDPVHRRYQLELVDESCRMASAVHNATTASQRDLAVRRLRAYQRDLAELSSRQ